MIGYQREPYLKIEPNGVYENTRSPAWALNADRKGTTPIPATADPTATPEWEKVSSGNVARWHDHRAHWMGDQNPPQVRRDPGGHHVINPEWVIDLTVDNQAVKVTGTLEWVPAPSSLPWVALAVVSALVVAAGAATRRWATVLAAGLVVLVIGDIVHAFGIAFANVGGVGDQLGKLVSGSFYSIAAWVLGAVGLRAIWKRAPEGAFIAGFVGVMVALFGGLADIAALTSSQVPFASGVGLARALVALALGLGLGLAVAAAIATKRHRLLAKVDIDRPGADVPDAAEPA